MGTNITIYDSPDSVNVNDPEATLTVYEMFIGVGPTGPTGPAGPAGAAAVAGPLPSSYVEMKTVQTVTSGTLIDIPGVSTTITLDSTVHIAVIMNCAVSSDGICDLDLGVSINGTDHDVVTTHLNGTTDAGVTTIVHRTETELAAGTYTVKGRFARSSGVKTPQVDRADFLVFALQGAKGADSTITIVPTADNDFVIGNSGGTWEKKTLAQTKTALSITNAPNVATTAAGDVMMGDGAGAWAKKTIAEAQVILNPYTLIGGVLHKQMYVSGLKPRITSGCAASAQIEMGTNKNVYDYLAFDKDTIEYAYANWPMPQDYTGGVVYGQPYWLHPATTTNFKVSWGISGVSFSNDDTLDAAQGTAIYSNDEGGTTSDLYIGPQTSAITIGGTPVAGDLVHWRFSRKADDATNDTLEVDAYLLGWLIWYPVR